jgi:hypothetical protein
MAVSWAASAEPTATPVKLTATIVVVVGVGLEVVGVGLEVVGVGLWHIGDAQDAIAPLLSYLTNIMSPLPAP